MRSVSTVPAFARSCVSTSTSTSSCISRRGSATWRHVTPYARGDLPARPAAVAGAIAWRARITRYRRPIDGCASRGRRRGMPGLAPVTRTESSASRETGANAPISFLAMSAAARAGPASQLPRQPAPPRHASCSRPCALRVLAPPRSYSNVRVSLSAASNSSITSRIECCRSAARLPSMRMIAFES